MLGSPNLYRGNASLAMRLRIDDLRAQLAPLDRYGVGGLSFRPYGRRLGARSQLRKRAARRRLSGLKRRCQRSDRALTSSISDQGSRPSFCRSRSAHRIR